MLLARLCRSNRPQWAARRSMSFNTSDRTVDNRRARILLVGSGRMGQIRASAINSNPRMELMGVVDPAGAVKIVDTYRVSVRLIDSGNQKCQMLLKEFFAIDWLN